MLVKLNLERMKRKKQRKPAMSLITNQVEEALGLGPFRHPQPLFTSNILIYYSILASLYAIHYRHLYQLLIYGTFKSYTLKMFLSDLPVCLSDIVRSSLFKQSLAIIHQMQSPKISKFRHIYGFLNPPPPDILSLVWSLCMFHISLSDSPNSLFGYFLYKYFANFVSQIFFYKYAAKSVCELFLSKKSANCCV